MKKRRGWVLLVLAGLSVGCSDGKSPSKGDTGSPPATGGSADTLDDTACAGAVPDPRRYAQMAWFFTETPMDSPTADRKLQRGFLLYGGMDPGSDFDAPDGLDDLWLYDLTARDRTDVCRWYQISAGTGDALFGGAMAYLEADRKFVIVGGFEDDGTDVASTADARWLSLDALSSGFSFQTGLLPSEEYAIQDDDLAECIGPKTLNCYDSTSCATLESASIPDPCDPPNSWDVFSLAECQSIDVPEFYSFCDDALVCTDGVEAAAESTTLAGRAMSGAAFDPVGQSLNLHGGVTGCVGTCSGYSTLFGLDLTGDSHLLAANAEHPVAVDLSGTWSATNGTDELSAEGPSGWPSAATVSLHGLGAAGTGIAWDLSDREWSHSAGSLDDVSVGGTAFQELIPSIERDVACIEWDATCATCNQYADTGPMSTGDAVCTTENGCLCANALRDADYTAISTSMPDLLDPAVAAILGNGVAVAGGRNESNTGGKVEVYVLDPTSGDIDDSFDMSVARFGAGVVYDPIDRKGYVFGGHSTNTKVEELAFDDAALVVTGDWTVSGYSASLTFDGTNWAAGAEWTQTYDCGSTTCYTDTLYVHVPTKAAGVLSTIDVEISYTDSGGTPRTADTYLIETNEVWSNADHRQLVYRLPVVIADGESITVTVEYTPTPIDSGGDVYSADEEEKWALRKFQYGELSAPSSGYLQQAVPAWPGLGNNPTESRDQVLEIDSYSFTAPAGYVVVAPGEPDVEPPTGNVSYTGYQAWHPIDQPVLFLENVDQLDVSGTPYSFTVDSGIATVRVYEDLDLSGASGLVVYDYTVGGGSVSPAMAEDAQFIVDRLGTIPTTTHNVVFLRSLEGVTHNAVGLHVRGTAIVSEFDEVGDVSGEDIDVSTTTLHELTHWYYGENVDFDSTTLWLQEAVPVLMELERYPDPNEARVEDGNDRLVDSHLTGSPVAAETATGNDRYTVGPYVLTQLYWSAMSWGHAAASVWAAFEALSDAESYGGTLDATEVEAQFTALTSSAFYSEWVQVGMNGVPLLGFTQMDYVASGPGGSGWEGVTVYEFEVTQVQEAMAGWDYYFEVPFVIGCSLVSDDTLKPFAECASSRDTMDSAPTVYNLFGGSGVTEVLTGSAALGTTLSPSPARVSLFRNERLLPGPVGGNEGAWSWPLLCIDGDTDSACTADADGDGAPTDGDCSEDTGASGADIYPFQLASGENPVDGSGLDYNCDDWSW